MERFSQSSAGRSGDQQRRRQGGNAMLWQRVRDSSRDVAGGLRELAAPTRCFACGARSDPPWCAACAPHVARLPPGCTRCASPNAWPHACWVPQAPIGRTIATYDYRGPVAAAIRRAKLSGVHAAWRHFGATLAASCRSPSVAVDAVTWVPTPDIRARKRDGDHAEQLAKCLADALQLPCRRTLAARQIRSGDVYRVEASHSFVGQQLLLVDDVVTTGKTAVRAARVLRAAGAPDLSLAVIARAGVHPLGATAEAPQLDRVHSRALSPRGAVRIGGIRH